MHDLTIDGIEHVIFHIQEAILSRDPAQFWLDVDFLSTVARAWKSASGEDAS